MAERSNPVRRPVRFAMAFVSGFLLLLVVAAPAGAQLGGAGSQPAGVTVTKTASPESLPEPGGEFTFTVTVANNTGTRESILALTDNLYGDLTTRGSCTGARNRVVVPGSPFTCTFTVRFEGNADASQASTTTVVLSRAVAGAVTTQTASAQTTITITNVPPTVAVTQSVAPSSLPVPGGNFNYTTVVTNTSQEDVTITSLVDDIYGNLANRGSCTSAVGTVLKPNATFTCSFVGNFTDAANTSLIDQVAVTVIDDDRTTARATATARVQITPTTTSSTSTTTSSTSTTSTTVTTLPPDSTTSSTAGSGGGTTTTLVGLDVLTGPSAEPGGELRVRGTGCPANSRVLLLIGTTTVGESRAGADGSFTAEVAAPDIPPGRIELIADCGPRLTAAIDIVVASGVDTGASTLAVFLFFVLLALVLFRRRRIVVPTRRHRADLEG